MKDILHKEPFFVYNFKIIRDARCNEAEDSSTAVTISGDLKFLNLFFILYINHMRMIEQAVQLGANAIVNVRFATSAVAQGASELYVYGTAVRVE
jgi:hypothetical protein